MSLPVDRDLRRAKVAEVAYVIVADEGIDMLTVRAVAKAMDCSTAIVSHYFSGKQDLLSAVYRFASERAFERWEAVEAAGGDLYSCLKVMLPIDPEMKRYWRVYFSFWSTVGSDQKLGSIYNSMLERSEENVRRILTQDPVFAKVPKKRLAGLVRQILALETGLATQAAITAKYPTADQQMLDLKSGLAKLLAAE